MGLRPSLYPLIKGNPEWTKNFKCPECKSSTFSKCQNTEQIFCIDCGWHNEPYTIEIKKYNKKTKQGFPCIQDW